MRTLEVRGLVYLQRFATVASGVWWVLARDAHNALLIRSALLARVADGDELLDGWAERIRPPDVDLGEELLAALPDFSDRGWRRENGFDIQDTQTYHCIEKSWGNVGHCLWSLQYSI